jgi:hypothetical protein
MRWALLALLLLALGGCGEHSAAEPPTALPADALPGLEVSTKSVSADDLTADFGTEVAVEGFVSGTERVFQGESHDLDQVVARTLDFESPEAAKAYVELLRAHAADLYGVGTTTEPLEAAGRSGYVIDPAACACHRAAPTLTAAVSQGPRVTYLEINGDGASEAALIDLLAQAP